MSDTNDSPRLETLGIDPLLTIDDLAAWLRKSRQALQVAPPRLRPDADGRRLRSSATRAPSSRRGSRPSRTARWPDAQNTAPRRHLG
jgi:hypothetical protein